MSINMVKVRNAFHDVVMCRKGEVDGHVLLDTGSDGNYVSESFYNTLFTKGLAKVVTCDQIKICSIDSCRVNSQMHKFRINTYL